MQLGQNPSISTSTRSFGSWQDALRTFLLRKLDFMGKEDRSQITMISTWAAELYLDKVYWVFMIGACSGNCDNDDWQHALVSRFYAAERKLCTFFKSSIFGPCIELLLRFLRWKEALVIGEYRGLFCLT